MPIPTTKYLAALTLVSNCLIASLLAAQQPVPANQNRAASGTKSVMAQPSEASTRAKIMAGDQWKQVGTEYQKWLSTQPIYAPTQIKRINEKLNAQMQSMPTSELQAFLDDWQAKLKVLNGQNFQEAQNWLGAYMTNMADGYRRQYLQSLGLTDIPALSAAQLENALTEIRANRQSVAQSQLAFDNLRQKQLQTLQTSQTAVQQARQQSATQLENNGDGSQFQGPYSPAFSNNFIPPFGSYLPL